MVISSLCFILLSNAVTIKQDKSILYSRILIATLILSTIITFNCLFIKALEKGVAIYGGLFNVTPFSLTFNMFIFVISAIILTLTGFYPRKYIKNTDLNSTFSSLSKETVWNVTGQQFRIIEYALVILFVICGAVFLISAADLVSVFLSIELQSYGLYILCTLYRDSESSTASGLTYFLLGGLSSCFILLGSSILYANSGTTNLDNIYIISSISQIKQSTPLLVLWYKSHYLQLSLIIMSVGFLFKVSAAPFHFWSPDVYDGIPTVVTTYVAIVAKISIFAFLLELVYYTEFYFVDSLVSDNYSYTTVSTQVATNIKTVDESSSLEAQGGWKNVLLLSSLFSLVIGSILGLTQSRIKRLFAYSTISHVGFILLALSIQGIESIQAYIFYILQYSISNLNAFIILLAMGYSLYFYIYKDDASIYNSNKVKELKDRNNSPIQLISQIKGYFYINPIIAVSLAITLFSFVGIPPLLGFFAKQMVLSAALDGGYVFIALVAILTSVIGAAYYLSLIKQIFFYKSDYVFDPNLISANLSTVRNAKRINNDSEFRININKSITLSSSLTSIISILTLTLVLFIFIPSEWFNIVSILTLILFKC